MRIAIAQIAMHSTTAENLAAIGAGNCLASDADAQLCCFSELAITGSIARLRERPEPRALVRRSMPCGRAPPQGALQ